MRIGLRQYIRDPIIRYSLGNALELEIRSIVRDELISLISQSKLPFSRGTTLPSPVPSEYSLFVLNRQASSQGDIEYASMQKSNGVWAWFQGRKAT